MTKLMTLAEKEQRSLGFGDDNRPNKAWIIKFLSSFSKKDEIFTKSYAARPIKKKKEEEKFMCSRTFLLTCLSKSLGNERRKLSSKK